MLDLHMVRTIDFQDHDLSVRQFPLGIQIADPARRVPAPDLTAGRHDPEPPARPQQVLLAERMGAASSCLSRQPHVRPVADPADLIQFSAHAIDRSQPLLDDRAHHQPGKAGEGLPRTGIDGGAGGRSPRRGPIPTRTSSVLSRRDS